MDASSVLGICQVTLVDNKGREPESHVRLYIPAVFYVRTVRSLGVCTFIRLNHGNDVTFKLLNLKSSTFSFDQHIKSDKTTLTLYRSVGPSDLFTTGCEVRINQRRCFEKGFHVSAMVAGPVSLSYDIFRHL